MITILREMAGIYRRWRVNRERAWENAHPSYIMPGGKALFSAKNLPYTLVGTGLSYRELNSKRKEVGDLWDSNVSPELAELGRRYNASEISHDELYASEAFREQLKRERARWTDFGESPGYFHLDPEGRPVSLFTLLGPTFGVGGDGTLPRVKGVDGTAKESLRRRQVVQGIEPPAGRGDLEFLGAGS